jgi:acetate---CoA ligase (ADP-forming)
VADLPRPPGLVYLMVPPAHCLPTLEQLRDPPDGVVVYSAGFREAGNPAAEDALCRWASANRVPLYGPQSLGLISVSAGFAGFCAPLPETIRAGAVGLVFQSGGLISGTLRSLFQRGIGISSAISYGNGNAVGLIPSAHASLARPELRVLGLYAEAAPALAELATRAIAAQRQEKPIVLLASGASAFGQRAAQSHTGALATSQRVLRGVAEQYGIVMVDDIDQMVWALEALIAADCRRPRPGHAGIISTSGGGAIMMADAAARLGLDLAQPSAATALVLAGGAADRDIVNPHDTGAVALDAPQAFERQVGALAADPAFGIVTLVTATGLAEHDLPRHLAASERFIKTVQAAGKIAMLAAPIAQEMARVQRWPGVPLAAGAQEAIVKLRALAAWGEFAADEWDALAPPAEPPPAADDGEGVLLDDQQARRLLQSLPVAWPEAITADTVEAALAAAERIGYPVVIKTGRLLSHKAQVGGVLTGLAGPAELAAAAAYMLARFHLPVVVSAHVAHGAEFIIGYRRDPQHGPLLVFGPGGATIGEVRFRRLPMTPAAINRLVAIGPVGIGNVIAALQSLTSAHPAIRTIDINPITAAPDGRLHVLDVKVYG